MTRQARSPFARKAGAGGPRPPAPAISRPLLRRTARLDKASACLAVLPGDGEALHAVTTGRSMDVTAVVGCLLGKFGPASIHAATLAMSRRNLKDILGWIDQGSTVQLLVSSFFWRHNKAFWANEALPAFSARTGSAANHWRNHCKVVALAFGDGSKWSLEGSANLRGCDSWEQFSLVRDEALHDFHAGWINERVNARASEEEA